VNFDGAAAGRDTARREAAQLHEAHDQGREIGHAERHRHVVDSAGHGWLAEGGGEEEKAGEYWRLLRQSSRWRMRIFFCFYVLMMHDATSDDRPIAGADAGTWCRS
jgi:hypothetical protein